MKKALIVCLFALAASPSFAAVFFKTGLELLPEAQQWNNYFTRNQVEEIKWQDVAYFQGYVSGVASAARHQLNLPEGAQVDQLCRIVYQYLQENSNELHEPAADLVVSALKKAFPGKWLRTKGSRATSDSARGAGPEAPEP